MPSVKLSKKIKDEFRKEFPKLGTRSIDEYVRQFLGNGNELASGVDKPQGFKCDPQCIYWRGKACGTGFHAKRILVDGQ